ncbi:type II toxin-antitoxin system RatA family toxin [Aestuariivirga sp.]|uniref:type II toxin-antitoxin system RatA family toxin n=1 Tax=Aestuariivirga sp. TaxID=2650926 RepID=UPI003593EE22
MPKFNISRKVPFSVEQVFAISADVGQYRTFLPLVKRSVVRNHEHLPDGRETFEADLTVLYKKLGIEETLTSRVTVDRTAHTVVAVSTEGPVKHLNSEWRILPAEPGHCEINLTVDYQLKSRTLQFVLSGMFDMVVRRMMNAFEDRAYKLYGGSKAASS